VLNPKKEQLELKLELPVSQKTLAVLTVDEIYERAADSVLLSSLGEDRRSERKSARIAPRDLGDYFSMWSNTPGGGLIFVGIEKDGEITGFSGCSPDQINDIDDAARVYCCDSRYESKRVVVRKLNGSDDFVLAIKVNYRPERVVKTGSGKAFKRVSDKIHQLSEEEIRELQIAKGEVSYELEASPLKFPDDFNMNLVEEFIRNVVRQNDLNLPHETTEVLTHQHLGKNRNGIFTPNNACCLLFARDPLDQFPGCKIRFMRYDGEVELTGEKYNVVKDVTADGPIPILLKSAEQIISSQLREYSALGSDGRFYSMPEYPPMAWYEAIVNAVVHRSYSLRNMNIFVYMFDDRLEVKSPGALPPMVTPENIFTVHHPRNPFLMNALRYFGLVKCANEGTRRMRDAMLDVKLPPPVFSESHNVGGNVVVCLKNNYKQRRKYIDKNAANHVISEALFKSLSTEEVSLINYVCEYKTINVSQAMKVIGREWGTTRKRLDCLEKKGIFQRKHRKDLLRDPNAHYFLVSIPG